VDVSKLSEPDEKRGWRLVIVEVVAARDQERRSCLFGRAGPEGETGKKLGLTSTDGKSEKDKTERPQEGYTDEKKVAFS
jgi:hypothetical protein